MTAQQGKEWNLRGWYLLPEIWIGLLVAALVFDVIECWPRWIMVTNLPQPSQPNVIGLILMKLAGTAFYLAPAWFRWKYSCESQKKYFVWTFILAGVVLILGLLIAFNLLMITSMQKIGGVFFYGFIGSIVLSSATFGLLLVNTIAIPRKGSHAA